MATTTATFSLNSSDLLSDTLALSTSSTLYKAGTTEGLDQTTGLARITLSGSTSIQDLISAQTGTAGGVGSGFGTNAATKVYIANKSEDATEYAVLTMHGEAIGRLYAGDWMFIPWSNTDADSDIRITCSVATNMVFEYMVIHE